jgi:outer membrane protein insertion porin family
MTRVIGRFRIAGLLAAMALSVSAIAARAQETPVAPPQQPQPQATGVVVDTVVVRGNQRVEESVIRVTSALQPGQRVTALAIQNAIRRLMATDAYSDVQIFSEGDPAAGVRLIVQVEERPLIAGVDFEGLERVSGGKIRDTLGLGTEQALNPNLVVKTEQMIRDMLAAEGVQLLSVDTALTPVAERPGVYRLTFNVREGERLSIAEIEFVGNERFSAEELREALATREEGFFWFRTGKFDRTRWEEDLSLNLPAFYGEHGYIDFAVVSDTLVVDPESGKARLTVEVREGPQYRLGEFAIRGASHFPSEQLERMFTAQRRSVLGLPFGGGGTRESGEVFDQTALESATTEINQLYRNEGYLFAEVIPEVQRVEGENGAPPTVDVTLAVNEGSPFYIDNITIEGNTYTHESVIRDRLLVFPGDVYNEDRLLQSYRSIAALGFFETPLPTPGIHPDPANGTVDLTFEVAEKQTGSINFGTAIGGGGYGRAGGLSGFLGYSQPNLFGQAKQADIRGEYGWGRSSFTASYTDPAVRGSRNSASLSLFHTDDRFRGISFTDGRYMRTGGSFRWGFPLFGMRWTRAFFGYSLSRYSYEARDVDECEAGNIFCQPSATASNLSLAITRDTKNHPVFPTAGTRQNVTIEQTGGPLQGDGDFQKLASETEWWVPAGSIGGGAPGSRPIVGTIGLRARTGAVFGDASRFPFSRFFLGGTQWGEGLRGYEESTVTPNGIFERDDPSLTSAQRLGDVFLTVSGEYAVRFNDNLSASVFAEAGNIWDDPRLIDPTRLYRSLGFGATVVTPFGPLGIDMAYGFDKPEPGWKFHFKINPAGF